MTGNVVRDGDIGLVRSQHLGEIGMALIADGFDFHVPRGYIYFAMAFAGAVEAVNIAARRRRGAHRSRSKHSDDSSEPS